MKKELFPLVIIIYSLVFIVQFAYKASLYSVTDGFTSSGFDVIIVSFFINIPLIIISIALLVSSSKAGSFSRTQINVILFLIALNLFSGPLASMFPANNTNSGNYNGGNYYLMKKLHMLN